MANAKRDDNHVPTIQGVSNADGATPLTPYVDSSTNRLLVNATLTGSLSGGQLVTEIFDYVSGSYPNDTTEVYTFKQGGAGGSTVATVTVVYTDNTKINISTVTKS